ncbi:MAG: hypothetical protein HYW37_01135 [Candidatus Colwellbacteria bacterium]|nr:hypothetical protein [Candidatus Colwellbacteria bacterium]
MKMSKGLLSRLNKGLSLDNSAKTLATVLGLLFLASFIFSSYGELYRTIDGGKNQPLPSTTKSSDSNLKLPFNTKETYNIQTREIPTFTEAVFDPLHSSVGKEQRVTVKVKAPEAIESVVLKTQGDAKTVSHNLKLLSGAREDGVWGGSWKINDTHDKIYTAILEAKSANYSSHIDLNFR